MDARVGKIQGLIELETAVAAPNYAPLPVVLERGEGSWLWDADGRRYLDFMSAYSAVSHGHAHPRLVRALVEQAQRVAVTSRAYHSTELAPFLAKLVEVADLDGEARALPASGGCESVETAIKAARRWGYRAKGIAPDRAEIVVARGNFHGRSTTVVGFSSEDDYRADFGPFAPGFRHFDFGDVAGLGEAINENTCAVLIEPIQGEAGIVTPPPGFLRAARELCTERNVLLIVDEIQSGLGRTGAWFAYMHEGIRPDAVIVGKALGGGLLPVSAFVARAPVLDLMGPGSHGSTFGGNPLAARVGPRGAARHRGREARRAQPGAWRAPARPAPPPALAADPRRARARPVGRRRTHAGRLGARRRRAPRAARRADQGHARNRDPLRATADHPPRSARLGPRCLRRRARRVRPAQGDLPSTPAFPTSAPLPRGGTTT